MKSVRVDRRNCPMRHEENGNCLPHGGFCLAVSAEICLALHNAYEHGEHDVINRLVYLQANTPKEEAT